MVARCAFQQRRAPVARTRNNDPLLGSGLVAEINGTIGPVTEPCDDFETEVLEIFPPPAPEREYERCLHLTQWVPDEFSEECLIELECMSVESARMPWVELEVDPVLGAQTIVFGCTAPGFSERNAILGFRSTGPRKGSQNPSS